MIFIALGLAVLFYATYKLGKSHGLYEAARMVKERKDYTAQLALDLRRNRELALKDVMDSIEIADMAAKAERSGE